MDFETRYSFSTYSCIVLLYSKRNNLENTLTFHLELEVRKLRLMHIKEIHDLLDAFVYKFERRLKSKVCESLRCKT